MGRFAPSALVVLSVLGPGQAFAQPASARARAMLDTDFGWAAGTIQSQLDRDPTLVPYGKGALFVPAMANPLDEPPVEVLRGGEKVAESPTGKRILLMPGTYEVRIGSGDRAFNIHATVREQNTTVVPASWAGLQVHVVDEQLGSSRDSYEVIRADDREYMGLGFGTDEQAGEPVNTWILKPGLYKIVRVGENYRARRDFATVRLLESKLTHFLLVIDPETGEFSGGGEVPEQELFRPRDGFFGSLLLGGDLSMNSRSNALGLADGISLGFRAFVDGRISVEVLGSPLLLQLQIEEGQSKAPELPWQKSIDRADIDALYVYRLLPWVGPYVRIGAETNLVPGDQTFENPVDVSLFNADGAPIETRLQVDSLRLSPSFGLTTLKEGAGLNLRPFKTLWAEINVRTGLGGRHRLTRGLFEDADVLTTPELEYQEIPSTNQFGVEATVLAVGRISRWVLLTLELDSLTPFDDISKVVIELEASAALKLTSYLSVNYVLRFLRDRDLTEDDRLSHDLLLRFSVELL